MNIHRPPAIVAVLPAAGIGSRMQCECPKQYLLINNKPIIEYALSALLAHPLIQRVVVALHPQDTQFASLAIASDPRIQVVTGGKNRADSVLAGLRAVSDYDWVLVHDAARPCLHQDDLNQLIAQAMSSKQGGILAMPARDTMKQAQVEGSQIAHTVDRSHLWHALTPQMFPVELLTACLSKAIDEGASVTDEASALEFCGFHPLLVSGRSDNIKVTRPEDLTLATFYLTP